MTTWPNQSAPANRRGRSPFRRSGFTTPALRSTVAVPAVAELGRLGFDAAGYLENMAVKVPAIGVEVDSRIGSARTMRIDGLAYYGALRKYLHNSRRAELNKAH